MIPINPEAIGDPNALGIRQRTPAGAFPLDLDALKALCDAAAPGPWEVYDANEGMHPPRPAWSVANDEYHNPLGREDEGDHAVDITVTYGGREDAAFIAAAREAVPALLAALAEARTGVEMIAAERRRQVEAEGWTPEHDAEHTDDELARAAACYAMPAMFRAYIDPMCPADWPWHRGHWKPGDRLRELVKAGALIAAEIDRLAALDVGPEGGGAR